MAYPYFENQQQLLRIEQAADLALYERESGQQSVAARRANGQCWYPIAIRDTSIGRGDYLTVTVERTTHHEIPHQFRFGGSAALFSNLQDAKDRIEGTVCYIQGNQLSISLRVDEFPDWANDGKLGVDLLFDHTSYKEMENALKQANDLVENPKEGHLVQVLTGCQPTRFEQKNLAPTVPSLNPSQQAAVQRILDAEDLAIVHGPPGTGKTTTIVQAIKALTHQEHPGQILAVAPSNTAVDLLTEKLADEGLRVVRIGNPIRVSAKLMHLTLDEQLSDHPEMKLVKQLKKQANDFRQMAGKYKRNFGAAEREQRKALFNEARKIIKDADKTEQYLMDSILDKAQVITATLVGANHYTIKNRNYKAAIIDEAGQALEPACWIPILKTQKLVLAGDHLQLPPTIKSEKAAREGLNNTLLEKSVLLHPDAVTLLDEQYRMNEEIMGYSSQVFYKGLVHAHHSVATQRLFTDDSPLLFIDTAGCGYEEQAEGTSIRNPDEALFVVKQVNSLLHELAQHPGLSSPSIAIIAPYKEQVLLLKEVLSSVEADVLRQADIAINSVDSFQGQERDVVFISMTRSNPQQSIGFLADIRRMNVAMTRARKKLVVIGDSPTLGKHPFYSGFIEYAAQLNSYKSAWEMGSQDLS
ncbi:DNA helicase, putative [bacterium A37T11]|nr:DNA helicase, putative [bacterium A37T11]